MALFAHPAGPVRMSMVCPCPYLTSFPCIAFCCVMAEAPRPCGGGGGLPKPCNHPFTSANLRACTHKSSSRRGAYLSIQRTEAAKDGASLVVRLMEREREGGKSGGKEAASTNSSFGLRASAASFCRFFARAMAASATAALLGDSGAGFSTMRTSSSAVASRTGS